MIIHYVFSYSIEEASTSSVPMRRRAVVRMRVGLSAAGYPLWFDLDDGKCDVHPSDGTSKAHPSDGTSKPIPVMAQASPSQ